MSNEYPIIPIVMPEPESPFNPPFGPVDQVVANPSPEDPNTDPGGVIPPPTGDSGSAPQGPTTTIPESGVVFWVNERGQFMNGYNFSNFGSVLGDSISLNTLPSDLFQTVRVIDIPTSTFPGLGNVTSIPLTISVSNDPRALGAFPMVPEPEVNCLLVIGMLVAGYKLIGKKHGKTLLCGRNNA